MSSQIPLKKIPGDVRGHLYHPLVDRNTTSFPWIDIDHVYKYVVNIQNLPAEILPLPKLSEK